MLTFVAAFLPIIYYQMLELRFLTKTNILFTVMEEDLADVHDHSWESSSSDWVPPSSRYLMFIVQVYNLFTLINLLQ